MLQYRDELTQDGIRVWAQDIVKGVYHQAEDMQMS